MDGKGADELTGERMKNIIFDTDIGGDCDDVAALDLLISAHLAGECRLLAVTYSHICTSAPALIRSILSQYGLGDIPIGTRKGKTDFHDCYSGAVLDRFPASDAGVTDAVPLLRRILAENDEVTVVATGSFYNIAMLLKSEPDAYSPLSGTDLVKEKVSEFAVMGGNFSHQSGYSPRPENVASDGTIVQCREYNIVLDPAETKYFFDNCPVPVTVSPFELGYNMLTFAPMVKRFGSARPDTLAYLVFGAEDGRSSWDPVTAYYAVYGTDGLLYKTANGKVKTDGGYTDFIPNRADSHAILYPSSDKASVGAAIDKKIARLM